jgi:hypothetical protein
MSTRRQRTSRSHINTAYRQRRKFGRLPTQKGLGGLGAKCVRQPGHQARLVCHRWYRIEFRRQPCRPKVNNSLLEVATGFPLVVRRRNSLCQSLKARSAGARLLLSAAKQRRRTVCGAVARSYGDKPAYNSCGVPSHVQFFHVGNGDLREGRELFAACVATKGWPIVWPGGEGRQSPDQR